VSKASYLTRLGQRTPGQVYLWLAVAIFGAASAIARKLTEIGSQHLVDGRNPISLCNVLFVGNLCALLILTALHYHRLHPAEIRQISRGEWLNLGIVGILAGGVAPALIFQALAITNVNNVILVGRLELPLTLLLSVWLFRERVNRWGLMGTIGSLVGIALTIALSSPQSNAMISMGKLQLGWGESLAALAAIALSIATIITKGSLQRIPMGLYSITRTAIGTILFFGIAMVLYGIDHFMDIFSPFLWQWMLIYGAVVVVMGQALWFQGLSKTPIAIATLVGSFVPIAGIIAAYWILGEAPTKSQYIGGGVLLFSIIVSQIGDASLRDRQHRYGRTDGQRPAMNAIIASGVGFRGL
jgi:drug/metabolite transporter (DMT)-like permease